MTDAVTEGKNPYGQFPILAITTAYEQGVGKGRQAYMAKMEITNPYDSGYGCDIAWGLGYEEGKEQAKRIEAEDALNKRAPVQGFPGGIPWGMHLEAYAAYCKRYGSQPALIDLEGRNCRGGFGTGELDEFIPGWRERVAPMTKMQDEINILRMRLAQAEIQKAVPYEPLTPKEVADLTSMIWGAPTDEDHLEKVIIPVIRTYEGLRLHNQRPADPANTPIVEADPVDALQSCVEALEAAQNGLKWYRDNNPGEVNGSDDEMDAEISQALDKATKAIVTLEKKDA